MHRIQKFKDSRGTPGHHLPVAEDMKPRAGEVFQESRNSGRARLSRELFTALRSVLTFLLPYRLWLAVAMVALVFSTSFGLAFPYLTGMLLDSALQGADRAPGWRGDINTIALVLLGCLAMQAVFSFCSTYWFYRCGESALVDIRRKTFATLIGLPMAFFARRRVGELSSRLGNDLTLIQDTLTMTIQQFLRQSMLMAGGIALVLLTSSRLALLMIATFPVLVLVAIFFGRIIRRFSKQAQDRLADGSTVLDESLQGIANVKAYGNEGFELRRYENCLAGFLRVVLKIARLRALMVSFIIFGIFGSIVLVFWYGAHLVQQEQLTFGELTRFILYTTFIGGSVASIAEVFSQVQKMVGATERVRELLGESPEVDCLQAAGANPPRRLRGEVEFTDVHFRYPSRPDVPVLRGINLRAAPGEQIALVGASGAGKSTIVSLLMRFYEPDSGIIRLDGLPAAEYPLPHLRSNMAVVPQEVLLFGGTIEENIAYGRPSASSAEVREASRLAACHDFIESFPEKYQTVVGDRGMKLSGGQRQRIAIARAILRNPSILILDEATSSLDSESERLIQQALETLLRGRTAFIIAHRLSTVRRADRIYVIESGRVIEEGTHEQLESRPDGTYRRLAAMQFGTGEAAPPVGV